MKEVSEGGGGGGKPGRAKETRVTVTFPHERDVGTFAPKDIRTQMVWDADNSVWVNTNTGLRVCDREGRSVVAAELATPVKEEEQSAHSASNEASESRQTGAWRVRRGCQHVYLRSCGL